MWWTSLCGSNEPESTKTSCKGSGNRGCWRRFLGVGGRKDSSAEGLGYILRQQPGLGQFFLGCGIASLAKQNSQRVLAHHEIRANANRGPKGVDGFPVSSQSRQHNSLIVGRHEKRGIGRQSLFKDGQTIVQA